jgi:hypothetical protein
MQNIQQNTRILNAFVLERPRQAHRQRELVLLVLARLHLVHLALPHLLDLGVDPAGRGAAIGRSGSGVRHAFDARVGFSTVLY